MNSLFVSIDIETLGLGMYAPIIELGAVAADWLSGEIIGKFHTYVCHNSYTNCEPYAMSMHPKILRRIATKEKGYQYTTLSKLTESFHNFLFNNTSFSKVVVAGKNAAGFDLPRLEAQCPGWVENIKPRLSHRVIDPGSLFWNPATDEILPDTQTCLERCGMDREVQHTALEDAMDVVDMVFKHVGRTVSPLVLINESVPPGTATQTAKKIKEEIRKRRNDY